MQEHFVRESNDFSHSDFLFLTASIADLGAHEVTANAAPEKRLTPDELIFFTHHILRI